MYFSLPYVFVHFSRRHCLIEITFVSGFSWFRTPLKFCYLWNSLSILKCFIWLDCFAFVISFIFHNSNSSIHPPSSLHRLASLQHPEVCHKLKSLSTSMPMALWIFLHVTRGLVKNNKVSGFIKIYYPKIFRSQKIHHLFGMQLISLPCSSTF